MGSGDYGYGPDRAVALVTAPPPLLGNKEKSKENGQNVAWDNPKHRCLRMGGGACRRGGGYIIREGDYTTLFGFTAQSAIYCIYLANALLLIPFLRVELLVFIPRISMGQAYICSVEYLPMCTQGEIYMLQTNRDGEFECRVWGL